MRAVAAASLLRRETDVSDNFLDSAWYFLRFVCGQGEQNLSPDDETQPWDPALVGKWLPVDMYIGGAEHSVLHLMYARFLTMALHDLCQLEFEEPFKRFLDRVWSLVMQHARSASAEAPQGKSGASSIV